MEYQVVFRRSAEKALNGIPERDRNRLLDKIEMLEADPYPSGSRKLRGYEGLWRIRSGNYRVVYTEPDNEGTIDVVKVGHRRVVYNLH
ncbi:type II toxin-antitoxin system RelE/ParE family toxin [Tateyamaria sp. syn59]|uniref:type II toxin-antitoxin system RelE family toxin n=1 Tax=Tateyamaria sp. syn59 TaxID=2576942 RepID=UPI0011BD90A8